MVNVAEYDRFDTASGFHFSARDARVEVAEGAVFMGHSGNPPRMHVALLPYLDDDRA